MRCEEALNLLNAQVDGELHAEDAAGLEAHLADCSSCRAAAEGLPTIDAELRRAFATRREAAARLAQNVLAALPADADNFVAVSRPAPATRLAWGQMLVGLAAGFLVAVAMFRPWQARVAAPAPAPDEPVARLAVTSGPVEVREPSQLAVFSCPPAAPIGRDATVRTGPTARCEISLADGSALRLDCNTEVKLHGSDTVEVTRGRVWSANAPGEDGPEFRSGGGTIVSKSKAQLALECQPQAARLVVLDGSVNVQSGPHSVDVGPGQQVRLAKGTLEVDPQPADALLETAWVNSVLALSAAEHPELVERVDKLLAQVGAAKLSLLYEDELRRLGDGGVPPLLAYLEATRDTPQGARRATAARIVADVAASRWIADLIALLTDANADVRFHAARGLERLTGRDQGCEPKVWQSEPWAMCEAPHKKWVAWWAANRDRYPTARRDIPIPASPPF